ncbi:MAG: calcium-binding protein [Anaerolineae bacterium]|nr:calcium-binding protein [Anaerolineae bacterium]
MPADRDEERENRIQDEAIVDANGPEEQAIGWWCYLHDRIQFPFKAKCVKKRTISPLKVGEVVEALRMAPEENCMHEMFVIVRWQDRTMGVPLNQIEGIKVDDDTEQAIGDWHYWIDAGHMF